MRRRPFMRFNEPTLTPDDEPALRKNGSYPSGHTLLGWSSALLLSEINPERADTILARGLMYGESRVIELTRGQTLCELCIIRVG